MLQVNPEKLRRITLRTPKTKRKNATAGQIMAIGKLMDMNFDKTAKLYLNGYSDDRVASETGAPKSSVMGIRQKYYGELRSVPKLARAERIAALEAQMLSLEGIVADQRIAIARLQTCFTDLATSLGVRSAA